MKKSLVFLSSFLTIGTLAGCNLGTTHEHTFKEEFAHDETNHWHEASCEHTDLISGLKAHNFGDDNVCDDCGYTKPAPVVSHEHTFASTWSKDETNHWHAATCEHNDLTKDLAAHIFGDDNICDDCGYVNPTQEQPHEHTFKGEYSFDETNHWYEATCEHHDLTQGLEAHNFGDDDVCDDCGYTKPAPFIPHEHTFANTWSNDETSHWHAATCEHTDLTKDLAVHNFGDDNVCDDCGYIKPAPAHVHTYDLEHWEMTSTHHWHTSTCEHTGLASDVGEHSFDENGECTVCGYKKEAEHFSFSFRSDYCELDNENVYEEGDEVELSLTVVDEFKASLSLPDEIEVYSDGVLLTKGTDYTYVIEGESGKLSLVVKGNIVVSVFKDNNESLFKISEGQFANAMDVSDQNYVQFSLNSAFYSSNMVLLQENKIEYSPDVVYRGSYSLDTSRYGGSFSCNYSYIENESGVYTEYNSDKSGIWTSRESNEGEFNGNKTIQLGWYPFLTGFSFSYDTIKDYFNSVTNAYELYFTQAEYDVKFQVTFYNGKLINIHYEGVCDVDRGIFGDIALSYNETAVLVPDEAKPHEHTYATEWSKDETNHWHASTCEHTGLSKDLGAHEFGDDNICDICGYELIVKEQHIVYFASNGGSNVQPELVVHGEKVSKPNDPTKENCAFLGWYESAEFAGNPYDFEQEITENVTLYALWGAKISYVNYDGETYTEENVRLNAKIGEPENPSWGEAHFLGWYESPDFDGTTFDFELGVSKNTTLYARYGYALELVGLNGETVASTLQPVDEVVSNPGDTSIDYYDFDNYYSDSEYTQPFEFGKKLTKDTKIYLKFIPKTYNITYVAPDALENLNPTSYVYSIGISNLLEPTLAENRKFYGWYFDSAYTQPATSISTELHEDVTLYAKIGTYYTITYNGWPKTIDNPNPTKVTQYDSIELDKSPLEAIEGITDVKFMFNGEEETSEFIKVSSDVTFDVVFSSPKTTITFDPNGGVFLPKNPFIYIDGPKLAGGKKKIEITNNNGTFNLYNHAIMDELESTLGEKGVFEGFYTDSEFKNPLSTTSIGANKVLNGSTIYAKFEENAETNIPFETHNTWDELPGGDKYRLPVYDFAIPEGVTTISLNLKVLATDGTHVLELYDITNKRKKIGDWSGYGKFTVNESINVEGMKKITLRYNYGGDQLSFINYSLSIEPETRDRCFVQCVSSGEPITNECYYYHTPEIPYVSIEKEYFSFDGWVDSNNNKVDLTSDWVKTDEEATLKANWIYSGHSVFANEIEKYAERCSTLLNRTDLDIENQDRLLALNRLNGTLLKVRGQFNLDPNRGYDQDLIEYNKSIEELNKTMWDWFGELYNGQLIDKRIEILNEYSSKGDAFAEAIRSTINQGLLELASLKNNPFEYHTSYIRTLTMVEAILVSF